MAVTAVAILGVAVLANRPATGTGGLTPVDIVGSPQGPAPIIGQPAPPLRATAIDGSPVELAQYAGSPVWITFGASWCQPCRAENPDIQAAYDGFRAQGLVVIGVYMSESDETVSDYASRVGLTYVKVADPDTRLSTEYRILGIPSHFFVDRDGVLRQTRVGTLDRAGMDAILAELMR
jgi:peroxiredoxin